MINNYENKIIELKEKLYKKYNRKYLAFILNVSENHVSRLLNGISKMTFEQYIKLEGLLIEENPNENIDDGIRRGD